MGGEGPKKAKLVVESGSAAGQVVWLADGAQMDIGSGADVVLRFEEERLAHRHARVIARGGSCFVQQLALTPHIFVNGLRVQGRRPIEDGDLIEIGQIKIRFAQGAGDTKPDLTGTAGTLAVSDISGPAADRASRAAPAHPPRDPVPNRRSGPTQLLRAVRSADEPVAATPPKGQFLESASRPSGAELSSTSGSDVQGHRFPQRAAGLQAQSGPTSGRFYSLDSGDAFVLGRAGEVEIVLADNAVSRRHCRLEWLGETLWAEDLKSANGSLLNGRAMRRSALQPGDVLQLGATKLLVCESRVTDSLTPGVGTRSEAQGGHGVGLDSGLTRDDALGVLGDDDGTLGDEGFGGVDGVDDDYDYDEAAFEPSGGLADSGGTKASRTQVAVVSEADETLDRPSGDPADRLRHLLRDLAPLLLDVDRALADLPAPAADDGLEEPGLDAAEASDVVVRLRQRVEELERKVAATQSEQDRELEAADAELKAARQANRDASERMRDLEQTIDWHQENHEILQAELESARAEVANLKAQLERAGG